MDTNLREIMELSLQPIREGIEKIETSIGKMTEDINEIKTNASLQQKDIDLIKSQLKAQEMTVNALRDCLTSTENKLSARINEIEMKDTDKKAKFMDKFTDGFLGKVIGIAIVLIVIGGCVLLGANFRNILPLIK